MKIGKYENMYILDEIIIFVDGSDANARAISGCGIPRH